MVLAMPDYADRAARDREQGAATDAIRVETFRRRSTPERVDRPGDQPSTELESEIRGVLRAVITGQMEERIGMATSLILKAVAAKDVEIERWKTAWQGADREWAKDRALGQWLVAEARSALEEALGRNATLTRRLVAFGESKAVVLPDDWRDRVRELGNLVRGGYAYESDLVTLIESWRPVEQGAPEPCRGCRHRATLHFSAGCVVDNCSCPVYLRAAVEPAPQVRGAAQEAGEPPPRTARVWQGKEMPPDSNVRVMAADGAILVCADVDEGDVPRNGRVWHIEGKEHVYAPWYQWVREAGPLTEVLPGVPSGGDPDAG